MEPNTFQRYQNTHQDILFSTQVLIDKSRGRAIPIQIYTDKKTKGNSLDGQKHPVVIINHGYGVKNSEYSSIAKHLTEKGYLVISIQHDLDTDKPVNRVIDNFLQLIETHE